MRDRCNDVGGPRVPVEEAPHGRQRSFTMVELVIVIAIIGTLIALLVPAVQKVRESANRLVCLDNLHQLSMASQQYDEVNGALPPDYHEVSCFSFGSHFLFLGPFVRLLPCLGIGA